MAAARNTFFVILMILSLFGKGFCQMKECSTADLKVTQTRTGKVISGKPEFEVTVSNNCPCDQSDVRLTCQGFNTVETIPSSLFNMGSCLVKTGATFHAFESIKFNYAWDTQATLEVAGSSVSCSS